MDKAYNHRAHEAEIYSFWENKGCFTPEKDPAKKPFTVIMPPPNANDNLHVGHARFITIEDALIRYHRMKGEPTLWLPGADHAGIETQYVFEKKLKEQGKSRFDFDRDTLYQMIWDYVMENKGNMENQLRALGASCDWTRNKFTLDPEIVKIVYQTFKKLWDDQLVYRGERIVNYCPRCGTAFSQLEVEYVEREDNLYYLDYGIVTIATTRPETVFADVAIAVNPKDKRYSKLIGKTATIPLIGKDIPIITDELADLEFGTGALKVTPGHDATDFIIGKKHNLPTLSVIDKNGRMINTPKKYVGVAASKAREEVVKDLENKGLVKKIEKINHTVGVCYRDKGPIEPLLSEQWFIKITPLAQKALKAIEDKEVTFVSKRYEKIARHWLENLRDWNISRQIVWGIRIPAWRCEECNEWVITSGETPQECPNCKSKTLIQDRDTFDTWFSSGQWPFATLKTTQPSDFEYFYPTSVMETGYDILPFWILRMIMLGTYAVNKVPFRQVLLHGLVRDKQGQKISKSKGNVVDPLVMIEKYGADALRMSLVWGALIENDATLSEDNIRGQRNFANKVWNIARFILDNENQVFARAKSSHADELWIQEELKQASRQISQDLENFRLNEAAQKVYDFVWHKLADVYLEKTKERREEAQPTLLVVLEESLKLLHPFMPFVTETIWQEARKKYERDGFFKEEALITAQWPNNRS